MTTNTSEQQAEESKQAAPSTLPDNIPTVQTTETSNYAFGFGMKHVGLIPQAFLDSNVYDETTINDDPSKALLDCNPHKISRKWRLVKKFEREMVCFDEARYLSDNFDEEVLEIVNAIKDAE